MYKAPLDISEDKLGAEEAHQNSGNLQLSGLKRGEVLQIHYSEREISL